MNIVLVNSIFAPALQQQGHTVLSLRCLSGVHKLAPMVTEKGFVPDLILQQEALGERVFFSDLPHFRCIKAFWSIDTHLNMFWHKHYARLFDVTLSPHVSLFEALPLENRLANPCVRLPWPAPDKTFVPHSQRHHSMNFVGRVDGQRPLRAQLQTLLETYFGIRFVSALPYEAMLELYADTRIIPNESIACEVNFRLMEGAACGACVVSPDIGEDQNALFEPGSECLVYSDGLELVDLLRFFHNKPALAERIGQAAWRRVRQEHLMEHKAHICAEVVHAPHQACSGAEAAQALWLAVAETHRSQRDTAAMGQSLALLYRLEQSPPVLAKRLQLAAETAQWALVEELVRHIHSQLPERYGFDCELSIFGAALLQGEIPLLRHSLARMQNLCGFPGAVQPENPAACCINAAQLLCGLHRDCELGFIFQPGTQCPSSAVNMLATALHHGADECECARLLAASSTIQRYLPHTHMGAWALEALHNPLWAVKARFGLAALTCYKVNEGLAELGEAWQLAGQQHQEQEFMHMLAAHGANHVRSALHTLHKRPAGQLLC